jgi:hypothetical protein
MSVNRGFEGRWAVNVGGSLSDVQKLLSELSSDGLRLVEGGDSFYLEGDSPSDRGSNTSRQWEAAGFVGLLNAAAHLHFGAYQRIYLVVANGRGEGSHVDPKDTPSIQEILKVAQERELFRKALLLYQAGGADGLFGAYDALSYELIRTGAMDYDRGMGTKEWIVERRWATDSEIDRFLNTVVHLRGDQFSEAEIVMSPWDSEALIRRLLWKFTLDCCRRGSLA